MHIFPWLVLATDSRGADSMERPLAWDYTGEIRDYSVPNFGCIGKNCQNSDLKGSIRLDGLNTIMNIWLIRTKTEFGLECFIHFAAMATSGTSLAEGWRQTRVTQFDLSQIWTQNMAVCIALTVSRERYLLSHEAFSTPKTFHNKKCLLFAPTIERKCFIIEGINF